MPGFGLFDAAFFSGMTFLFIRDKDRDVIRVTKACFFFEGEADRE